MRLGIALRFGDQDELTFRAALSKDGMVKVYEVLQGTDATAADATMRTDLDLILSEIEGSMGVHAFNEMIREGLLTEYKKPARKGLR